MRSTVEVDAQYYFTVIAPQPICEGQVGCDEYYFIAMCISHPAVLGRMFGDCCHQR